MDTFENKVREYREYALRHQAKFRAWLKDRAAPDAGMDDEAERSASRQFALEHPDDVAELERLEAEVAIARAGLDERWVEAHEVLGQLRGGYSQAPASGG